MNGIWRIDSGAPQRVAYWIYEGDTPMLQCYNEEIAKRIVNTMNQASVPVGVSLDPVDYSYKKYLDEIACILHPNANEHFVYVANQLAGMVQKLKEERKYFEDYCKAKDYRIDQLKRELEALIEAIQAAPIPADYR